MLEIEFDRAERRSAGVGLRRRHAHSYAIVGVAAAVRADGSDLRVGVTGAGPTAVRARTVEQSRNADDVLQDVEPVDDAVASSGLSSRPAPQARP